MGMKLAVVTKTNKGELLSSIWYNWGAYTVDSLDILEDIIANYCEMDEGRYIPPDLFAYKLSRYETDIEMTGLSEESYNYMKSKYPTEEFVKSEEEDDYVITMNKEEIESNIKGASCHIYLTIGEENEIEKIEFDTYYYVSRKEIEEEWCWSKEEIDRIKDFPAVFSNLDEELDATYIHTLKTLAKKASFYKIKDEDKYITWYE